MSIVNAAKSAFVEIKVGRATPTTACGNNEHRVANRMNKQAIRSKSCVVCEPTKVFFHFITRGINFIKGSSKGLLCAVFNDIHFIVIEWAANQTPNVLYATSALCTATQTSFIPWEDNDCEGV